MRRKIDLRVPEGQLLKILGFADEMLTMVESNQAGFTPEEDRAAKELRHILNKLFNIYKEQVND